MLCSVILLWSESFMHAHVSFLFWISFSFRSPQSIPWNSLCYTWEPFTFILQRNIRSLTTYTTYEILVLGIKLGKSLDAPNTEFINEISKEMQDIKLIFRNLLNFCTTNKIEKQKLRQSHFIHQKDKYLEISWPKDPHNFLWISLLYYSNSETYSREGILRTVVQLSPVATVQTTKSCNSCWFTDTVLNYYGETQMLIYTAHVLQEDVQLKVYRTKWPTQQLSNWHSIECQNVRSSQKLKMLGKNCHKRKFNFSYRFYFCSPFHSLVA